MPDSSKNDVNRFPQILSSDDPIESQALYAYFDGVITPPERSVLFSELAKTSAHPAGLAHWDGTEGSDRRTRDADIRTLEQGHWLADRMFERIQQINSRLWQMSLAAPERIQVLDYTRSGHYLWHFDVLPQVHADQLEGRSGSNRLLTAVLNLSDESDYSMGDLQLHDSDTGMRSLGLHGAGTMAVFPSNHWHRATPVTSGVRRVAVMWVRGDMAASANHRIETFTRAMAHTPMVPDAAPSGPVGIPNGRGGLLVYMPYEASVHVLEGVPAWIWEARTHSLPEEDIATCLIHHFGVSEDQVEKDMAALDQAWVEADIVPDATASIFTPKSGPVSNNLQLYRVAGTTVKINYDDAEVEEKLRKLLLPFAIDDQPTACKQISVEQREDLHLLRIDGGNAAVISSANRAVSSTLIELQSIALTSGGAALALGAGAIAVDDRAVVLPDLRCAGREALLYAMSVHFVAPLIATSCLPYYRGDQMVEAMPLPLKLRELDLELLDEASDDAPCGGWYGTDSDKIQLRPAALSGSNNGRRYNASLFLFVNYDAQQSTQVERIKASAALARLMETGSYFVDGASYQDILQLSNLLASVPAYALRFDSISAGLAALQPLMADLLKPV